MKLALATQHMRRHFRARELCQSPVTTCVVGEDPSERCLMTRSRDRRWRVEKSRAEMSRKRISLLTIWRFAASLWTGIAQAQTATARPTES